MMILYKTWKFQRMLCNFDIFFKNIFLLASGSSDKIVINEKAGPSTQTSELRQCVSQETLNNGRLDGTPYILSIATGGVGVSSQSSPTVLCSMHNFAKFV